MQRVYCDLAAVQVGQELVAVRTEEGAVFPGSLVELEDGRWGIAQSVMFMEDGGEAYAFLEQLVTIREARAVYRRVWPEGRR